MILKLFLIFWQSEPNDSYKEDSYKKKSVMKYSCSQPHFQVLFPQVKNGPGDEVGSFTHAGKPVLNGTTPVQDEKCCGGV